jgi:hypothetical protein
MIHVAHATESMPAVLRKPSQGLGAKEKDERIGVTTVSEDHQDAEDR